MNSQVYYRKWRPQSFADVVGQEHVTQTLLNALGTGQLAHAYLFCGPRGTGKTSMGRILAKAVNCQRNGKGEPCNECTVCIGVSEGRALDLIEIDAASNRGIDEIRSLREKVNFVPNESRYKVYIIDEVHMLTKEAFNALLKTLEEPPPHTIFVLATTEAHKLPPTVISRCQRFDFRRIAMAGVVQRLAQICKSEGVEASADALALVARSAGGSLRDASNVLERLAVSLDKRLEPAQVREVLGLGGDEQVRAVALAAVRGDVPGGLTAIGRAAEDGLDMVQFHRRVLETLRDLLLISTGVGESSDLSPEERKSLADASADVSLARVVVAIRAFHRADLRSASPATLPLELALVEATAPAPPESALSQSPAPRDAAPARRPAAAAPPPRPAAPTHDETARPAAPAPPAPRPAAPAHDETVRPAAASAPPPPAAPAHDETVRPVAASAPPPPAAPAHDETARPVTATPAPAVAGAGEGSPFQRLVEQWKTVIEASRGKGQRFKLDALLRDARPISVEDGWVTIGFKYPMFVDRMTQETDNPGTKRALEDAIEQVLGERPQVKFTVAQDRSQPRGGHLMRAAIEEMGARPVKPGGTG